MKSRDKVFVVREVDVVEATIKFPISYKGVVTGYEVSYASSKDNLSKATKVSKKNIFTDEEDATKALFIKNLKKAEEAKSPAQDVQGDRHWIAGHKRSW